MPRIVDLEFTADGLDFVRRPYPAVMATLRQGGGLVAVATWYPWASGLPTLVGPYRPRR
jgi:hypothetical protein